MGGQETLLPALLALEQQLFEQEYAQHYLAGESKPREIGQPYLLQHPQAKTGVLLVHGLMAAPEEVREWAEFLHQKGLTVYAPRLAGHGTSCKDLSTRRYEDWLDSAERGHAIFLASFERAGQARILVDRIGSDSIAGVDQHQPLQNWA